MVDLKTEINGNFYLLKVNGDVDASSSIHLDKAINQAVKSGAKHIIVDCSDLNYISSAGLGVFMSYLEDFEKTGVRFVIYGLNTKVKNVFHILGLDQLLAIKDSEQGALEVLYEE